MDLDVVILAAGKGTRMRSKLPKVLHPMAGKPMLLHVLDAAQALRARTLGVVVGHGADIVRDRVDAVCPGVTWVHQAEQLGTGHAVQEAMKVVPQDGVVLVLYGDVPLVSTDTLNSAVAQAQAGNVGLVTAEMADPAQLGRIVRDAEGAILAIVEFKDADAAQRQINEINSGIMAIPGPHLMGWLDRLNTDNAQGELYLTDIIAMAVNDAVSVVAVHATPAEVTGVNDRVQLAEVERIYQQQQAAALMRAGVTMADPSRVDIRGQVTAGEDCFLDINVVLEGEVSLGHGVRIGAGAVISNASLGDNTEVHPHTVVEGATVAANCALGPFARIRPNTVLEDGVKIGNFVETKKSHLGPGTKASHLAYLGDATFGKDCNIGAGAITANYDGVNKFPTNAGDNVFVGTNVTMVAPLNLKDAAFLAAGSTVTKVVEAGSLAVARGRQKNKANWPRPDGKTPANGVADKDLDQDND